MSAEPAISAYASTVAQVVPVLLLAALATELLVTHPVDQLPEDEAAALSRGRRWAAFGDLALSAAATGLAFLAEFVALFGVRHGVLSTTDADVLSWLLFGTFVTCLIRILLPIAQRYNAVTGVPVGRSLRILGTLIGGIFVLLFLLIVYVE